MMRLAAAAVIFLCSIAAVSAQEPTGAPSTSQRKELVFSQAKTIRRALSFVSQAMLASNVKAASGHATLS